MIFSYYDFYLVKLSEFNRTSIIYTLVKDRRLYPYENFVPPTNPQTTPRVDTRSRQGETMHLSVSECYSIISLFKLVSTDSFKFNCKIKECRDVHRIPLKQIINIHYVD